MSLSFVKSAVLTSTDGVSHNTEKSIDNAETTSLRKSASHKPLFEQLRSNKEEEDEKYAELQRQMRGTRTLDEEDVAHLDSVDRMREEKEMEVKSGIEREVALFRAARVDRGLARTSVGEDDEVDKEGGGGGEYEHSASKLDEASVKKSATNSIIGSEQGIKKENKAMVPKFTIKKKRKRASPGEESKNDTSDGVDPSNASKITSPEVIAVKECDSGAVDNGDSKCKTSSSDKPASKSGNDSDSEEGGGGILGLGCYGSDSD